MYVKFRFIIPCVRPNIIGKHILNLKTIGNLNDILRDKRSISDSFYDFSLYRNL